MMDYQSKYSGPQIDEAVGRSFEIDMSTNGWIKLKTSENDPYNLDYLQSIGNYTIFYFEGGTAEMNAVLPLKISVLILDNILTQIVAIMDKVQSRQYINEEWTAWETWYSTGYIYQQTEQPSSPMRNALWIDTSDISHPAFKVFDGLNWREVRPTDAMDKSVYDPQNKSTDVFAYIDEMIKQLNQMPDGENSYSDAFAVHIADNVIHFTGNEKKELLSRPTKEEIEKQIQDINNEMKKELGSTSSNVLDQATSIIESIKQESTDIRTHIENESIHVDSTQVAAWENKADKDHEHRLDGKVKVDCADLISGIIPIEKIPPIVLEQLTKVQTKEDMYKLTIDTVQNGDTVYVVNDREFYYVINDKDLTNPKSFMWYAATLPASVPWEQVVEKPTTRDGFGITDVYTMDETDKLISESDYDTTNYLTTIFSRTKQMYTGKWYYKLNSDPDIFTDNEDKAYSSMRVINKDGNIHYLINTNNKDTEEEHCALVSVHPYDISNDAHDIDYNIPARYEIGSTILHELGSMDIRDAMLCEINDDITMLDFYRETTLSINVSINNIDLMEVPKEYTHIYSTKDNILYRVDWDSLTGDPIIHTIVKKKMGIALYTKVLNAYTLECIDPNNTDDFLRNYAVDLSPDIKFDGVFTGFEMTNGEYVGAFVVHNRTSVFFYPATETVANNEVKEINFGKDYIIADTIYHHGNVVALLLHADDVQSVQNSAWKAYQLHIYVAIINPVDFTFKLKDVAIINDLHEVGSSIDSDYQASLDNIYDTIVYKSYPLEKGFKIVQSNGATIIYSTIAPLISINLTTWSQMSTQWIDYENGIVIPIEIHAENLRNVSCCNNDAILITRMNGDTREWAFSVDNYNFYSFRVGYCWDKYKNNTDLQYYGYTTSLAANHNGIYIISTPYYNRNNIYNLECLQFKLNSVTNAIDNALDSINQIIEEETGIPTTKTEFYEFEEMMRAPVDITNGETGYYSIFVDTSVPNPKNWHYIHYVNGDIKETIPPISNMPTTSTIFYIKGGFMYNNSLYILLHFVNDDGSISITIGTLLNDSIVIVSPTIAKPQYIDSTNVQHLRYQIFKKNDIVYVYPNFTHEFTGPLINKIPIIIINCASSDFMVSIKNVPEDYHIDVNSPDIQWMGVLHNRVFLFRTNNSFGSKGEVTYWDNNDFTLSSSPVVHVLQFESDDRKYIPMLFTTPFAPFVVKDKILFALNGYEQDSASDPYKSYLLLYEIDLNTGKSGLSKIKIEVPNIQSNNIENNYMYQSIFDDETNTIYIVMTKPTKRILVYRIVDEDAIDNDAIIQIGEINEESLSKMAYGKDFVFDDILTFRVNHTFMIMSISPNLDSLDSRDGIFIGTPIISFLRDNGSEIYKKSYVLAAQYTKNLKEYKDKFDTISENITMANKYTNAILRILG